MESRQKKIKQKKEELEWYRAKKKELLTGTQSYTIGSRNLARYQISLGDVDKAIKALEKEIEQLETGKKPRKAVAIIPRDW